jgi:amino acid adenylation domain-containing protein
MSEQLRLLSGAAATVPAALPAVVAELAPASAASTGATPHFGPFRGIDRSAEALTPYQQRHLDAFIARYVARTKASKALTERQRPRLADPRAISGFRRIWKEIVYQIATDRSAGARVWDIDGNEYIDLTSSFGVTLFGFGALDIDRAVHAQLERGIELGTLSPLAKEAADLLCELTGMERATFANTGSEAIAGAIRAVRTATGREWIAVFDDEYHGIAEEVLVRAVGPKGRQRPAPAAPGIPEHFVDKVIVLHYDDPRSLDILRERADEIAGVVIEPVQNRHPDFRPIEALRAVRAVTAECDIPLIFDEMITGFRLHPRGAQGYFGIEADVACYGKIMSGGLPIAAVAGKARYLDAFDGGAWQFGDGSFPEGGVTFFGGTFTRNSLSLSASVAALRRVKATPAGTWTALNATGDRLAAEINALFARYRAPMHLEHCGSMFHIAYTSEAPLPRLFCSYLRLKGIHIWDRPFFLTLAHTEADLAAVVRAVDDSLAEMQAANFLGDPEPDGGSRSAPADDVVPFTTPQMEVWLGSQTSLVASSAFNEVTGLALKGRLSLAALEGAVADVTARHESLRMTVAQQPPGFRPGAGPLAISTHDLRAEADPAAARDAIVRAFNAEPLDFERGPLWRLGVIHEPERDVLVIAVHHLMCDGWSFGVLLNELSTCYAARLAGTPHGLPPALPVSTYMRDHAARRQDEDGRATEAYWLEQYRTLPEPLALPTDRPRPPVLQYAGGRLGLLIDAALASRVRHFASAHRVTLFSTLHAAFNVLIHRLSGQRDFVVGIPMAGQAFLEDAPLVAHCVNFIAMRCRIDPEQAFGAYVAALTRQALEVNEHQEFTYLELLRALKLPRVVDRDPLVTVSFTIDPAFSAPAFGGVPAEVLTVPRTTARRDLHVNVLDTSDGLAVDVDYDASIFDEATVRAWMEAFRACLAAAIDDPSRPLWRLPLMAPDEQRRLAAPPAAPAALRFDPSKTLVEHFEAQVERTPEAAAQTCGGRTLTYRQLNARANRIARALVARGGARGSLVGVCLQRGEHLLPALLGVLKAGAAYLPIDLAYPPERLAFMLRDAAAPVLLTERALAGRVPPTDAAHILVDDALDAADDDSNLPIGAGADDLAYVIYTSGTTGQPKGSLVTHRNVVSLMAGTAALFEFSSRDVWTLFHSSAFDFSVWEMWGALLYGGRVVIVPLDTSRSPEAFHELLVREQVTVLNQTPSAFRALMTEDPARGAAWASALRYVIFGGEALDLPALRPWFERHGDDSPALVNMYGITETTVHVTYRRVRLADTAGGSVIGTALPLYQLYVLDPRQQPVPVGVPGEIYVGGAGVTGGYLRRPELTSQRFLPNPFGDGRVYRSGDLARRRPDGGLDYLGRIDQQVKIRGFRVELGEVEAALGRHAAVAECRVVAREGEAGPRLVAYLVAAGASPDPSALQAHLRATLPEYMVPAVYVAVDRFPLTASGKLDLRALPDPDRARLGAASAPASPASSVERQLAEIWCALLSVPAVGRTEDFFDLGGHSLLALTLGQRIEETFGVRLSPVALFAHSRLDALAACIEAQMPRPAPVLAMSRPQRATPSTGVLARMHSGGAGRPFVWVHGIGGEVYSYLNVTRHLGARRPVYGFAADWTTAFAESDRTLERIAAAYVAELTSALPEGPYHLGGYCSGAVLVLEMARQLEAAGRTVGALVVVDYDTESSGEPSAAEQVVAFVRNLPWWLYDDAVASGAADLAGRVKSKLRRMRRSDAGDAAGGGPAGDIRDALGLWRFPASKAEMLRVHLKIIDQHRCQPIDSRVTVLRPRAAPLLGPWRDDDSGAWAAIARGGVDIDVVPGSHSTILNERFAPALAQRIEDAIAGAEADVEARLGDRNRLAATGTGR